MKKYGMLAAACGLFAAAAAPLPAAAQDSVLRLDRLAVGVGAYDVFAGDDRAIDLRVDAIAEPVFWKLQPFAGLEATTDGSVWGGIGLSADFYVTSNIVFTPSTGVGLYAKGGGKDLGGPVQFRTALQLSRDFGEYSAGLGVDHKSNAGIYSDNPGSESIFLTFSKKF